MKNRCAILLLLCCTGCLGPREMKLYRVVDVSNFQPIPGAKVWAQPYAPIHPFWPFGARGITDANGQVRLSLPADFWFYINIANAKGYSQLYYDDHPTMPYPADTWAILYMKRDTPSKGH
jgi:hypothetical protein